MQRLATCSTIAALFVSTLNFVVADQSQVGEIGTVIFQDDFERTESDPAKEEVGNGWSTNSKSRAQGVKQVDLDGGIMKVTRAEVADHGVSVVQDLDFQDALISLKFQLGPKDDLGINIADMKEKSVHAGHICMAKVRSTKVELVDLKTGRMNQTHRTQTKAGTASAELKKLIKSKQKNVPLKLKYNEWHDLSVRIEGSKMTVTIDGKQVGTFNSPGISHATKSRIRLAINRNAWVDDLKVVRLK
ncbi:MAG: family 16 glycoside hydrolase [Fuerstiella sp.]